MASDTYERGVTSVSIQPCAHPDTRSHVHKQCLLALWTDYVEELASDTVQFSRRFLTSSMGDGYSARFSD